MFTDILTFFNHASAREKLSKCRSERYKTYDLPPERLEQFETKLSSEDLSVDVLKTGVPKHYRLCYADKARSFVEVKFQLEGYLIQKSLPPFESLTIKQRKNPLFLKQEVFITGWGDPVFDDALQNALFIYNIFSSKLPTQSIKPFGTDSEYRSFPIFQASNRFFTAKTLVPYEHLSPLPVAVDPNQKLYSCARASSRELVTVPENEVEYYKMTKVQGEQKARTEKCTPSDFEIGDLVQIQFSFVLFSRAGNRSTNFTPLNAVLRSLTLLDSSERNAAVKRAVNDQFLSQRLHRSLPLRIRQGESDSDDESGPSTKKQRPFDKSGAITESLIGTFQAMSRMD